MDLFSLQKKKNASVNAVCCSPASKRLLCDFLPKTLSSILVVHQVLRAPQTSHNPFLWLVVLFFFWPPSLLPSVQICSKAFQYCWHLLPTLTLLQLREIWSFRPCCWVSGEPVTAPPVCCSAHVAPRQKKSLHMHTRNTKETSCVSSRKYDIRLTCNSKLVCVRAHTRVCLCVHTGKRNGLQTHHCTVEESLIHI